VSTWCEKFHIIRVIKFAVKDVNDVSKSSRFYSYDRIYHYIISKKLLLSGIGGASTIILYNDRLLKWLYQVYFKCDVNATGHTCIQILDYSGEKRDVSRQQKNNK